jgi:D-lactate dehydrogenase (cytochrome)
VVLANGDVLDIRRGTVTTKTGEFIVELTNGAAIKTKVPTYRMPAIKNAAGLYAKPEMDFIDLFIGSEGILGVITEVELRLLEYPERTLTVFAFFPTEAAATAFVKDIRGDASPVKPLLLEYFDNHAVQMLRDARAKGTGGVTVPAQVETAQAIIFFEVPFKEAEMEATFMAVQDLLAKHRLGMDATWAGMEPADLERMKAVRHLIPETVNSIIAQRKQKHPLVHKLGTDMAVPNQHLETIINYYKKLLDEAGMEYIIFGHIGDNHLHVNILPRTDAEVHQGMAIYQRFARKAVELGGTVSAEHGIGKLKRPFLRVMYGDEGLAQIAQVKRALDPNWILNPSNMIPRPGETLEAIDE